jgi:DNA mismatch repair ATPase MutS
MYSVQLALAGQKWRRAHGAALETWLRALRDLEALESLATYSFEHPDDPFPEIAEGLPCFEAAALGHPLIAAAKCVRNDVALGGDTKLLLVSGSNMSGKSTLLRAIGINAVLAMAGAPVRAARLRITHLHIGASIQVNDSLQEGRSRFYSEILRLRAICELAEQRPPILFLLDELLDGTNSSDRLTGATGIAHALLASGAIGLISTHDLALTEMTDNDLPLRNVHFEERIEGGEMHFDFRLRDGIVTTRNGVALMRMVGLKV